MFVNFFVFLLIDFVFGVNVNDKVFFCFLIFNVNGLLGLLCINVMNFIYCVNG